MWFIFITNPAKKHLTKIPKKVVTQISSAIDEMRNNPLSGDLTKLSINNWRRRVGDYRIVFKLYSKEKTISYWTFYEERQPLTNLNSA